MKEKLQDLDRENRELYTGSERDRLVSGEVSGLVEI